MISFFVPGVPVGKGRPRITTRGGKPRAYTPAKTVNYESEVATVAHSAMDGSDPFAGPVALTITATFPIPPSWKKAKQEEARAGRLWHTSKPDGDNCLKALGDALNGIVWNDDSQVSRCAFAKVYGDRPGVHVFVEALA